MARIITISLAVLALVFTAGAPKQEPVALRIHPEGGSEGGHFTKPVITQSGRQTSIATMPLINESSIQSFHPFPATDGSGTFGAYFRLDAHGKNLYSQHTMSRRGTWLFVFLNGRKVVDLYIDQGVKDDVLSIPTGFNAAEIETLKYRFPPFGQEGQKPPKRPKPAKPAKQPKPVKQPTPAGT